MTKLNPTETIILIKRLMADPMLSTLSSTDQRMLNGTLLRLQKRAVTAIAEQAMKK